MNETTPASVFVPYLPPQTAAIKVHNTNLVGEPILWIGHTVFIALAIVALTFIVLARGPRRREANIPIIEEETVRVSSPTPTVEVKQG